MQIKLEFIYIFLFNGSALFEPHRKQTTLWGFRPGPTQTGLLGETLDSVSTVFNEIAQHPPHSLFAVCNWSIGHPR